MISIDILVNIDGTNLFSFWLELKIIRCEMNKYLYLFLVGENKYKYVGISV